MHRFLARSGKTIAGIALVAVLSIAGIATANRAIRDGSINSRDIKDNQVNTRDLRDNSITTRDIRDNQINTRDLRDGAIRGVDVRDGSLELSDLSGAATDLATSTTLVDPRAHGGGGCCLSWARGPERIGGAIAASDNPLPDSDAGQAWRSVALDPGTYVVQSTGRAWKGATESEGVATRLFLGGHPLEDVGGYSFYPAAEGLPTAESATTVVQVGGGDPAQRQLAQRVTALGGDTAFSDNLLVWKVSPR